MVVPIPGLNRAVVQAINVGRSISDDIRAVYISDDQESAVRLRAAFERQVPGVPLVVVESPYRALAGPLLAYLDVLDAAWPPDKAEPITFVVVPEYVARSWWERILYNQAAKRLRAVLLGRPHTVVVNVPYRREDPELFEAALGVTETGRSPNARPRTRTARHGDLSVRIVPQPGPTERRAAGPDDRTTDDRRGRRWYRDRRPCQMPTNPRSGAHSSPSTEDRVTPGPSVSPRSWHASRKAS